MLVVQDLTIGNNFANRNIENDFELNYLDSYLYRSQKKVEKNRPAKFDLTFNFDCELNGQFYVEVEYATSLFKDQTITRIIESYFHLINQVLETPDKSISAVSIVTEKEEKELLQHFNQPIKQIEEHSIIDLLKPSFLDKKAFPAILTKEGKLSYEQLDDYSTKVAASLHHSTPELGSSIGLFLDRTEWMVISILGVLKSGRAYVPIDLKYPGSRIDYIIEDAQLDIIITDNKGLALLPENYKGRVIHIEEFKNAQELPLPDEVLKKNLSENTAYLIYTSGSTGEPKGVDICHRNTIAFLNWAKEEFADTPFNILYATTSYCFDLSVFEFFFPLMQGKTIRLLDSALDIPEYIGTDEKIMINTVPSVARTLIGRNLDWTNVTAINLAGEAVPKMIKERLDYQRIEIRNLYGPSEDTTYSTVYNFEDEEYLTIPIGIPVGDTQLYILDQHQNLLPIGVNGEIYLSGQSVAKGYYNKPELTAERFIENPFVPGIRMYKTGDIGKWLPDGKVEFIGRIDAQVKIRGFRIELGEIQYVLEQNPKLNQAAVVIREIGEEPQIIAYWTGDASLMEHDLKAYTTNCLPHYMVPFIYVFLEEIPLNSNGKVDLGRLPEPMNHAINEVEILPPVNALQTQLLQIWKEVLQLETIGVRHNFFRDWRA